MESTYNANRYRGQHGQISFITGAPQTPEEHKTNLPDAQLAAGTAPYALAPVQDFQRRGERNRSRSPPPRRQQQPSNDVIDLDLAQYKQQPTTISPYAQPPSSKYLSYPAPQTILLPSPQPASQSSEPALLPLIYDLRSSLHSEQEARKHLEAQLHDVRMAQQAALGEVRATVGAVGEEVKGGESRWLTLTARVKEMELAASMEGRYSERNDRLDAREQATQHQSVAAAISELRAQMEDRDQRYRDELEATHREYGRTIAAMKEQQLDARQLQDERWQQQMDTMQQRVQLLVDKAESTSATTADVTALAGRLSSMEASSTALDSALRHLTDATRREGEEVSSKGDWLRGVLMEQLEGRAKVVEGKIETVEEGRRLMMAAVQKEIAGMRDDMDRRLRDMQTNAITASEHERQTREDMELRAQASVKQAYSSLSTVIKDTVSALNSRVSELESSVGSTDSSVATSVQSLGDSHAELESVLRAEVKTRMKSYNKTKAQLDLLNGQVAQLKQMVGTEDGEVRKVAAEVKATEAKLERMKERVRDMRAKGDEEAEKERRMLEEVRRRVDGLEEMKRRVEAIEADANKARRGELDDVRKEVDELKRAVAGVEKVSKAVERLKSDDQGRQQQLQTVTHRMDEADRWMNDQVVQLNASIALHEQDRIKREQTHRVAIEQLVNDELERLKRTIRDQTRDQLASHATHTELHAVSALVQSVRAEMEERDRSGGHRLDQLARSLRGEMDAVRQSGLAAGGADEEDKEAEKLLNIALETRGVLDDMMAAVDQDNQQQAIDAIRQHVNTQLQGVDGRLHACELHVNSSLAAQSESAKRLPEVDKLAAGLEAVRVRGERHEADAQRWRDDIAQQLQHISLTMLASGDKREQPVANRAAKESASAASSAADKHELLAVKADVTAVAARLSSVEDELSKKVDYTEESHAVLQQLLTGVEVKVSRMEAEWATIREERQRQRNMSISSNPASARHTASSAPLAPLAADTGLYADLSAVKSELHSAQQALAQQVGELESKVGVQQQQLEAWKASVVADLQQHTKLPQPSKPDGSTSSNGSRSARRPSDTAKLSTANAQLSDLAQRLVAQQDEHKAMKLRTEEQLRQLSTDQQQLMHGLHQLNDKMRQSTSQSQRGASTGRLSDSEGVLLASLSSSSSTAAAGGEQTELKLKQLEHTLSSQVGELSARLTELSQQVRAQPAVSEPTAVAGAVMSRGSISVQPDSAVTLSAEMSHLQQAMVAQVGELSWRINELAGRHEDIAQQLTALSTNPAPAVSSLPAINPPIINRSARTSVIIAAAAGSRPSYSASVSPRTEQWNGLSSEVDYLKQQLHVQVGEMSWKMAQLQSQFDSLAGSTAAGRLSQKARHSGQQSAETVLVTGPSHSLSAAPSAEAGDDKAAQDSQLEHLRYTVTAQLGELSFRLSQAQQALRDQLQDELHEVNSSYEHVHQQLEHVKDRLATSQPPAAAAAALVTVAGAQQRADTPKDLSAIAHVESKVEHLQQTVTQQVAELSYRINDLATKLEQTTQPSGPSVLQLSQHPEDGSAPPLSPIVEASVQSAETPLASSRRSSQALASSVPLQAAMEAVQAQWQQQFKALVDETQAQLNAVHQQSVQQPPAATPAQPNPTAFAAFESELSATSQRLSSLVAHVQRLEESAASLRSTEAAEMEDIIGRITGIYKKSKDDIAGLQAVVADIRLGMDAKEEQLRRLDEHVVDDMRRLMDDMVRVEGEGKGERLLMQRKLREIEHTLALLSSKLNGRPTPPTADAKSARSHVPSPRRAAGGNSEPDAASGASKLSFLSPANGGRVQQHGRSASSIEGGSREVELTAAVVGRSDSQQEITPRHHPHISIELTTPLTQPSTHGSDSQSIDDMYDQQVTPKPSDDSGNPNHTSQAQPRDATTPSPLPQRRQPGIAAFHDRNLSIEVNAAPTSFVQQQAQPQSPFSPLMSTRSLNQTPKHSSPQHVTTAVSDQQHPQPPPLQPQQPPQHRHQSSEPSLPSQPAQSSPRANKGKPSSRAQPSAAVTAVQTDRPAARELQRRTSASRRMVDMAAAPEASTGKGIGQQPVLGLGELGGLSVSGSAVSGITLGAPLSMESSTGLVKRPLLPNTGTGSAKHSRTQSASNKSAGVYETKLQ